MDTISIADLDEIAYRAGLDADSIHERYTGRGMVGYGEPSKTCVGFAVETTTDVLRLGAAMHDRLGLIPSAAQDGMGRGKIVYFPSLKLEDES
jgi:hypothetical protein